MRYFLLLIHRHHILPFGVLYTTFQTFQTLNPHREYNTKIGQIPEGVILEIGRLAGNLIFRIKSRTNVKTNIILIKIAQTFRAYKKIIISDLKSENGKNRKYEYSMIHMDKMSISVLIKK